MEDKRVLYTNGFVTVSEMTDEEIAECRNMDVGVEQTSTMIRHVAEHEGKKYILEITANGVTRKIVNM